MAKQSEKKKPESDGNAAGVGHNLAADNLRALIERIERLEEEKAGLSADIRDVFAEAKAGGFDVKAMRKIISLRRLNADERAEQEHLLDTYKHALGMLADTPLGEAAMHRQDTT